MQIYTLPAPNLDPLQEALGERYRFETGANTLERATLLDTFDGRLRSAALELRHSAQELQLLPGRDSAVAPRSAPCAQPPEFAEDLPVGPLRDLVEPLIEIRRLLPVITWQREVTSLRVLDRRRKTVVRGELARAQFGGHTSTYLEIRPVRGYDRALARVREALASLEASEAETTEGEALARATGHLWSYDNKLRLTLHPEMRADLAMRLIHLRLLDIAEANIPGLRRALDVEFLHDFRVALRKSRSGLSQVRRVFPEPAVQHFKEELRTLFRRTGRQRDLDVFLLSMPDYRGALPPEAARDLDPLQSYLERQQAAETKDLDRLFRSQRTRHTLTSWRDYLESEIPTRSLPTAAQRPIHEVARQSIHRIWNRVLRDGGRIGETTEDAAVHAVRVQIKKLRYLFEFFRSILPAEAKTAIRETKRLQENLGRFADYSVQQQQIRSLASDLASGDWSNAKTLLAMGQLLPQLEAGQQYERQRFHQTFGRFSSAANQKLMKGLLA